MDDGQGETEFRLETFRQVAATLSFVICDGFLKVALNCGMKFERHFRARRRPAQNASSERGVCAPDSISPSRRRASARSSSAEAEWGGGVLARSFPARCNCSSCESRNAAASISASLVMAASYTRLRVRQGWIGMNGIQDQGFGFLELPSVRSVKSVVGLGNRSRQLRKREVVSGKCRMRDLSLGSRV